MQAAQQEDQPGRVTKRTVSGDIKEAIKVINVPSRERE